MKSQNLELRIALGSMETQGALNQSAFIGTYRHEILPAKYKTALANTQRHPMDGVNPDCKQRVAGSNPAWAPLFCWSV